MSEIILRGLIVAMFCLPLLSCMPTRAVDSRATAIRQSVMPVEGSMSKTAIAVIGTGNDDAEKELVDSLCSGLGAAHVGVVRDMAAARVAAGKAGARRLIVCEVVAYSAYDPSSVSITYAVTDAGRARQSWQDVVRRSRRASASDDLRDDDGPQPVSGAVEVDAAHERTLNAYAFSQFGPRWGTTHDLLEAEILLRDPKRFLPFAAELVVEDIRASVLP